MAKTSKSGRRPKLQSGIQYLSLFIFLLFIALTMFPSKEPLPLDIFLRLDPLIAIGTSISTWEIIDKALISILVVIATLLFGRIFCGYICPLGTSIDLGQKLLPRKTKKIQRKKLEKATGLAKLRKIKYYLLTATLVSSLFGLSVLYILDPISLITRTTTNFFYPLAIFLSNALLDLIRPIAVKLDFVELSHFSYSQPLFGSNLVIILMFSSILLLSITQTRFWCRYLCPLGALLGIFSKTSVLRRRVSEECINCSRCKVGCPMNAIPEDPKVTLQSECLECKQCSKVCPKNAISFKFVTPEKTSAEHQYGFSRRALINSAMAGFTLGFIAKTSVAQAKTVVVRPPGAIPEDEFLGRCIRCGQCIKSCITNTLQPVALEAGLEGIWTPKHDMRLAGCEQECNMCGQVCPTQAIRSLDLEERKYARVGTAVIIRDKCLAWEQNRLCIICDEQCPYNAIVFKNLDGHKRPFVDETKCNGCGICEQKCPIIGESAIVVWPIGEIRLEQGSYFQEAKRLKLSFQGEEDELEDINSNTMQSTPNQQKPESQKLPAGFTVE